MSSLNDSQETIIYWPMSQEDMEEHDVISLPTASPPSPSGMVSSETDWDDYEGAGSPTEDSGSSISSDSDITSDMSFEDLEGDFLMRKEMEIIFKRATDKLLLVKGCVLLAKWLLALVSSAVKAFCLVLEVIANR